MTKQTTIAPSTLQAALVGFEIQRSRIEAAIAQIQAELGRGRASRPASPATSNAEPKAHGNRRFSAAARQRMAMAQKKRWKALKAKKAAAKKAISTAAPKRRKATAAATTTKRPVSVRAAKSAPKPTAKKMAPLAAKKATPPKPRVTKAGSKRNLEGAAVQPTPSPEPPVSPVQTTEPIPAPATE